MLLSYKKESVVNILYEHSMYNTCENVTKKF